MILRSLLSASAALVLGCLPQALPARTFTVDDLLHQESFGNVAFDPSGRWLAFEQRAPYDTGDRYDYGGANPLAMGRVYLLDLKRGAPRPLIRIDPGPGVVLGPFSPSGDRVAVYRLHDHSWTLGVVTLATGDARWFALTPLETARARSLQWLSDTAFLVIARTDGLPPRDAREGWIVADRLPKLWAAVASGEGAHTVLGSGAYADLRARAPANRLERGDARTGAVRVLATGAFTDLELSPDHRRAALFKAGADLQARGDAPLRGPAGSETEANHLTLLDLQTGAATSPCPACDLLPQLLSWSPDSRRVLAFERGAEGLWTGGHLLLIDAADGARHLVGQDLRPCLDLNPVRIWTTWLANDPVVLGRMNGAPVARDDWYRLAESGPIRLTGHLPPPDRFLRLAGNQRMTVLAGANLWAVDPAGRHPVRVATGVATALRPDAATLSSRVDRLPQVEAWVQAAGPAGSSLTQVRQGQLRTLPLAPRPGAEFMAASPAADAAVRRVVDARGVQELWLDGPGRAPTLLATLNSNLADASAPSAWPVRHTGPAGEPLTSWLFLPQPAATPAPLIVRPYLGASFPVAPQERPPETGLLMNIRLLTAHGYAVLVPSLPNPPGGMTDPADHLADRILGIVDAAAADPAVSNRFDIQRMGLMGFSWGGYSVMTAITQTHRFRAAVAISGVSDLVSYWASLSPLAYADAEDRYLSNWHTGGVEVTQPRMLAPPWREKDRYLRNSPLLAADRIETPLLLLHSALDPIPHAGSEAMYSALFRQGKDAILVTYWEAMHGINSPGDVRDVYARTFAFLDERLAAPALSAVRSESRERGSASVAPRPRPRPPSRGRSPRPSR